MRVTRFSRKSDSFLSVVFSSKDIASLRASLNTNLRLAATALRAIEVVREKVVSSTVSEKD